MPRDAACAAAALPMPPRPTTITSKSSHAEVGCHRCFVFSSSFSPAAARRSFTKPSGSISSNSSSAPRRSRSPCLLCAFMGGMALGSWLLPRLTPKGTHPFRVVAVARSRYRDPRPRDPARASLHSAGLPDARRTRRRRDHASRDRLLPRPHAADDVDGRHVAGDRPVAAFAKAPARQARWRSRMLLYMANLAGGATGTVLAGFYLLRVLRHGRSRPYVAVTINVIVAAAFWRMSAPHLEHLMAPEAPEAPLAPRHRWHLRHLSFTSQRRFLASPRLGAEVVWTRQLSLLFGASVYTFSLILAVFLAGLGIGGLVGIASRAPADRVGGDARHESRRCSRSRSHLAPGRSSTCLPQLAADGAVPAAACARRRRCVRVRRAALRVRAAAGDDPVGRELPAHARRSGGTPISAVTSRASTRSTPPARSPARSPSR